MNFKKIKNQIIKGMAESVISAGFLFNKNGETFEKNVPGGVNSFYFLCADYGRRFIFKLWWGVRIDSIADIYNRVTEKDEEFFDDTQVLSNHLGALIDYIDNGNKLGRANPKEYIVLKEEDVETVIGEALTDLRKYILPYFEQNTSIATIDQLLNYNPKDQTVHNLTYPNKAVMGLIAAKLTKNPEYDQLVGIYDIELTEAADRVKREYVKLKELLSKM